jgi:hypothetical protein
LKNFFFFAQAQCALTLNFSKKKPQKDPLNIKILNFLFLPWSRLPIEALWCKNKKNPCDENFHTWAPLRDKKNNLLLFRYLNKKGRNVREFWEDHILFCILLRRSSLLIRVQWFWLIFTFWGTTTHPWHPKGPRIWKLAKKKCYVPLPYILHLTDSCHFPNSPDFAGGLI